MELIALLLLLAVLVLVVLFVARPLVRPPLEPHTTPQEEADLLSEREHILANLQELDFDYALGKIPEADYAAERARLIRRGADLLRQLDARKPRPSARKRRLSDEDLEALIAKRRQARREKAGGFCPQCGKPVLRADKFCPSCGHNLKNRPTP
ncbi:MAG: zinc ribbon domain-containing protein [Anaerolineales bacterium]